MKPGKVQGKESHVTHSAALAPYSLPGMSGGRSISKGKENPMKAKRNVIEVFFEENEVLGQKNVSVIRTKDRRLEFSGFKNVEEARAHIAAIPLDRAVYRVNAKPEQKIGTTEIETMRLFIAEALLMLSSVQARSNPVLLDDMEAKARCFMTGREAAEIIQAHDRHGVR